MQQQIAPRASRPASLTGWHRVHEVLGPPAASAAPLGLYVLGAEVDGVADTGAGPRARLRVPAGRTAGFGTYCGAFPAAQWHRSAGSRSVLLEVRVDAAALLTVHRSDATGTAVQVAQRLLAPCTTEAVELDLVPTAEGGLVWFDLQAGPADVLLLDAAFSVRESPRHGRLVIGSPTNGRAADVAANLARIASAPALLDALARVVVVDQAPAPIGPEIEAARPHGLVGLLDVVRQANLGGSGGYARIMHEALRAPDAGWALLLDDDVIVEPAGLLRALELARRAVGTDLVGLQMLDAGRPGVLDAAAERIDPRTFWWTPTDPELTDVDVASGVQDLPALHRCGRADFAGWWAAVVPLDAVRAVGGPLPLFLKWDDAEYALRAAEAGYRTVSLTGAAVWHESWRSKDDSRSWRAFLHSRNRLVAALLHGAPGVRTGVLAASLALEVKQLLALHVFAVERRQEGLRAVLQGPQSLDSGGAGDVERLVRLAEAGPDQRRIHLAEGEAVAVSRRRPPGAAPRGPRLLVWAAVLVLRHLVAPVRGSATRLPAGRGTWWELPWYDHVLAPTADGGGYFRLVRDPGRFRAALVAGVVLHARLWLAWPRLRRRYRAASPVLVSPEAWARRFDS